MCDRAVIHVHVLFDDSTPVASLPIKMTSLCTEALNFHSPRTTLVHHSNAEPVMGGTGDRLH